MREIRSKEEIDRKKRMNQLIVGGVLILLMVLSTLGFAFFSNPNSNQDNTKIEYNGYEFIRNSQGLWDFEAQGQKFQTINTPEETEDVNISFDISLSTFYGKPLYYIISNTNAVYEIEKNIARYALRTQEACLMGEPCEKNLAVKNCTDNIMVFKETEYTKIYKRENCIFIESPYSEQERISDKIIFKILGI